ncbi:MAG: HAD family hydrolase [Muribaculaceae bacterium]|nr:HAD family hydrolase [Muribaculaceae bacterium]
MQKFDSLLFDMDGTLWDAVESYCAVWNATIARICPEVPRVHYHTLAGMMGKPLRTIYDAIIGPDRPFEPFFKELLRDEAELMPRLGGKLYPGVKETLAELSRTHTLIMVSNCNADGLPTFLRFTGLEPYFTDHISFGETGREKDYNIGLMVRKHSLKAPLYIGDTAGDCDSAHRAGVPFAWASYGFGRSVEAPDYTLGCIADLLKIVKDSDDEK